MNPENDRPSTPQPNPTVETQSSLPASNTAQPTVRYGQEESSYQAQGIENSMQGAQVVAGDSSQQPQNKPAKHKIFIIIVGVLVLLLIVGVAAFFFLRSNSNSEQPASNNTQPTSNNEQPQSGETTRSELNDNLRIFSVRHLMAEIANFQTNNNGAIPTIDEVNNKVIPDYVLVRDNTFSDPTTNKQYMVVEDEPKLGEMQYATASACDGGDIIPAGTRYLVVRTLLESGEFYCLGS